MSETKRMHYVPQTYLKHFSTALNKGNDKSEYFIYSLPVSELDQKGIKCLNIKNICLENDIYKLPGESKEQRMFLEIMYRKLYEDDYDKLYQLLIDETKETVTPAERYSIVSFVVSMFYRNNSWGNAYNKLMDETYAKVFALAKANGKNSFFMADKEISIEGKTLEQFQKENQKQDKPMVALIQAQKIFELIRLRMVNDVVTVVKIKENSFEFITSDTPVTYRKDVNHQPIPIDPANTLSIPIDSTHLLQLRPWADQLDPHMIGRMSGFSVTAPYSTLINNHFQSIQAGRFVLGTETGLKKFLTEREKYNAVK